jgi:MFS family permease
MTDADLSSAALAAPPSSRLAELTLGWRPLIGSTIGLATGWISIPIYTNAIFFPALHQSFGWSLQALSLVLLGTYLVWIPFGLLVGGLVDRFGTRVPAFLSGIAMSLGYLVLSTNTGSFAAYAATQVVTAALAIGTTHVTYGRTVSGAFNRMRGLALAIALTGIGVVAFLLPVLLGPFVAQNGPMAGYRIVALVVGVGALAAFVITPARSAKAAPSAARPDPDGTENSIVAWLRAAVRDRVFVSLAGSFMLIGLGITGLVAFLFTLLTRAGLDPASALWAQSTLGAAVVVGRLLTGALVDRFFAPRVGAVMFCISIGGLVLLAVDGPQYAFVGAVAIGLTLGAEVDLMSLLVSRYFPLRQFARAVAGVSIAFVVGTGFSPLFYSSIMGWTSSLAAPLLIGSGILLVAVAIFFRLPRFGAAHALSIN